MTDPLIEAIRAELELTEEGEDILVRHFLRALVSPKVLPLLVERGRLRYDLCRRGCAPGFDDFVRDSCATIFRAALGVHPMPDLDTTAQGGADGKG